MSESAPLADTLGRWQRGVVTGVGVILVVHSVIVALWLAPSSPIRQAVGDSRLSTYVDPYFQQGDQIVAVSEYRDGTILDVVYKV